jgi:hypothetical protein
VSFFFFKGKGFFVGKEVNTMHLFIPKHIDIEALPELNVFSYNVLIVRADMTPEGKFVKASVVYKPDIVTYKKTEDTQSLCYLNNINSDYRLEISYNNKDKSYRCDKFKGEENLGIATGNNWKQFFAKVGVLGLAIGENCMLEEIRQ